MTTKEQREIIQAYERGEVIEWRYSYERSFKYSLSKEACGEECDFDFINRVYRIKPNRWRAEKDNGYYYILSYGDVNLSFDVYGTTDKNRYSIGNYFHTKEQAEKAIELLKECLAKFHEEND